MFKVKNIIINQIVVSFFFLSPLTPFALAGAGGGSEGGGDGRCSHFQSVATRFEEAFEMACSLRKNSNNAACGYLPKFQVGINQVLSKTGKGIVPNPTLTAPDGSPRLAGNNGFDEIQLRVQDWSNMGVAPGVGTQRVRTVAHEFNVVSQNENQDHYDATDLIIKLLIDNNIDVEALAKDPIGNLFTKTDLLKKEPEALSALASSVGIGNCITIRSSVLIEKTSGLKVLLKSFMKNLEGSGPHTSIYVDYWIRVLVNNQTLKNFYSSKSPDKANIEAGKYLKTLIQSDSCGKLPLN